MTKLPLLHLVLFCSSQFASSASADEKSSPRTITVTGTAEVMVVPDQALFTVGIQTFAETLEGAKRENDSRVSRALDAIRKSQPDEAKSQTSQLTANPRYEYHDGRYDYNKVAGFDVTRTITILLTDMSKFEALTTDMIAAGVNQIQDVDLQSSETTKHRAEARVSALKVAREKATQMAGVYEQKLGRPMTIDEGAAEVLGGRRARSQMVQMSNVFREADGDGLADTSTLALGQISIRATVTVTFELQ